jgi:hypothetical protein
MAHQPTLFMRVHKTAGEAMAKQIRDRMPESAVCPAEFEWQVRQLTVGELRRYSFFQGHISPSALSAVFIPLRVFTMLRSPAERLLSCFHYWQAGSMVASSAFFDAIRPLSLPEFLRSEDPIVRRATWNAQARLIAGGRFGDADDRRQNVFGPQLAQSDLAAEALRGLDRFAFVGTAERYAASLRAVYALLQLGDPPPPEWINVTRSKPASYGDLLATPEIADAIAPLIGADQIVYDVAARRLDCLESEAALTRIPPQARAASFRRR